MSASQEAADRQCGRELTVWNMAIQTAPMRAGTYGMEHGNTNCSSLERASAATLIDLETHLDAPPSPEIK
jgi:hypothetical protein